MYGDRLIQKGTEYYLENFPSTGVNYTIKDTNNIFQIFFPDKRRFDIKDTRSQIGSIFHFAYIDFWEKGDRVYVYVQHGHDIENLQWFKIFNYSVKRLQEVLRSNARAELKMDVAITV